MLCFILLAVGIQAAHAQIVLPSDVGVTMTALPSSNLQPGQQIDITLNVTNFGPTDVPTLILDSSIFVDEFHVVSVNASECNLVVLVIDLANGTAEYQLDWDVAGLGYYPPLLAGVTLTCHFQIALTQFAPSNYTFSFGLPATFESDSNPTNDRATVTLQRGPTPPPPTPLPALSVSMLGCLALLSAALGLLALGHKHDPMRARR
ncbi:MAG TPA: hypothetical protein VFN13_10020 [Rudaea sp.]|nr:hypothetical protein [Rudaea sp.]